MKNSVGAATSFLPGPIGFQRPPPWRRFLQSGRGGLRRAAAPPLRARPAAFLLAPAPRTASTKSTLGLGPLPAGPTAALPTAGEPQAPRGGDKRSDVSARDEAPGARNAAGGIQPPTAGGRASTDGEPPCWACGGAIATPVLAGIRSPAVDRFTCAACGKVIEPRYDVWETLRDFNCFSLFGLPVSFDVDLALLRKRYHKLQLALHPDRHAAISDRENQILETHTAKIAKAYATLCDPIGRAKHLLQTLYPAHVGHQTQLVQDQQLLDDVMQAHETLEEVQDDAQIVLAMRKEVGEKLRTLTAALGAAFAKKAPLEICECLQRLQLYDRVAARIDAVGRNGTEGELNPTHSP
eukprot:GHVT01098755.1.p1 GENE.GHVT01098755.1~~GHVT01098755.1.p1  ORF type:complete len:352 (-),score=73.10 GHVT01098755.1:590-1645(-)